MGEEIDKKARESLHFCPKCNGPLSDLISVRKNEREEIILKFHFNSFCPVCGILRTAVEYLPKFCENCASQFFGVSVAEPREEFCWFCGGKMRNWSEKRIKKNIKAVIAAKKIEHRIKEYYESLRREKQICADRRNHEFALENAILLSPPFFTLICAKCKKIFIAYSDSFEG